MEDEYETVPDDFDQFDATLSLEDPLKNYRQLVDERIRVNAFVPTEMGYHIWDKISAGAREAVWKLLFDETDPPQQRINKAAELLSTHRSDACFYSPSDYNDWIVEVRDELLKRNMLDIWKDLIVAKELGPAWARDSDLYDDMDDPEPANFYNYAGCKAVWLEETPKESCEIPPLNLMTINDIESSQRTPKILKPLSATTPADDYKFNMQTQTATYPNDAEAFKDIFAEVRLLIWQLLFAENDLKADNAIKATKLLEEYRRDACIFEPFEYNEWIIELRDELFKRKYFDFWQQVIVKKQLGLCWAKNSDNFDDKDDPKPLQFYESGEDLMKPYK